MRRCSSPLGRRSKPSSFRLTNFTFLLRSLHIIRVNTYSRYVFQIRIHTVGPPQVRELESSMAQLEAERSALKMRSTSAEEQLAELQGAMASNILR